MEEKPIQQIKNLFNERYNFKPIKSHRTERGDLISYFTEKINAGRVGTKYKPLPISSIGNLLKIYTTSDLYFLRMKCEKAKNFYATFWYFVKPKTKPTPR